MTPTEELLYGQLETAAFDPAFIAGFKARLIETGLWEMMGCPAPRVKRNSPPPSAPDSQNITAIRTALFDNWPGGGFVKGTPNRYGMAIEIWTLPADEIEVVKVRSLNYEFKSNVSLMNRKALLGQVKNLRKPRANPLSNVDREYLDCLVELMDACPDRALLGMLNTTIKTDDSDYARGMYYHPWQFLLVQMDGGSVTSAQLNVNGVPIDLAPFDPRDHAGERLGGNVVAQSRTDLIGFDSNWASSQ